MGIFGALTTAVTGMRAQAFALENVSGNIANSQTTAFKRIDTAFQDMIPDTAVNQQLAGSVVANSRSTNTVQGDIQAASIGTFMAINGDGYFVVERPVSFDSSNNPVFTGNQLFTRRGDFQPDKNGYLVNGAGYYLKGIPIDPLTGLLSASTPQMLQFQDSFLPAQATSQIDYHANLARDAAILDVTKLSANPVIGAPLGARITGTGAGLSPDASAIATGTVNLSALSSVGGTLIINGTNITIGAGNNLTAVKAAINAQTGTTGVTATSDSGGHLILTGPDPETSMIVGGASTAALLTELGLSPGTYDPTNLITQGAVNNGQTLTVTIGAGVTQTLTFGTGNIMTLADLTTALAGLTSCTASVSASGDIRIIATTASDDITLGGTADASNFGMAVTSALPATREVVGKDVAEFLDQTLDGGVIAAHDVSGTAVNVRFRWAKVDSVANGGADTWNLFYQTDSTATGNDVAWINSGTNYVFGANGQMNPPVTSTTLSGVTVDGIVLGNIDVVHGSNGITQFTDTEGVVKVNQMQENSVAAGELQSVAVSDKGRIVGTYTNGRTLDLADLPLANFTAADRLKRIDGGAFEITDESGSPVYGSSGNIVSSSLEGSNTDIADEFTKLIITQQAYSANTKVITTSNQMVQDLLNMLR